MCGIFGIVGQVPVDPEEFGALGTLNTVRGNLGFGALVCDPGAWRVFRYASPFDASRIPLHGMNQVLGHVRAPTGGQSSDLRELHPFETDSILLAHNGLLLNHADYPQWRIDPTLSVDSQVIAGGIQYHLDRGMALPEAIKTTVEALDGQQACWLWHKPTHDLYLWRVMAPIYVSSGLPGKAVFSSMKSQFTQRRLEEGIIYRLDLAKFTFLEVQQFSYYSPYHS